MINQVILRAVRIADGQKKLADLSDVNQSTVWRWLHGGGIDIYYVLPTVKATGGKIVPQEICPNYPIYWLKVNS